MPENYDGGASEAFFDELAKPRMPKQKPGSSKQDYGTPLDFIAAVKRHFGIKEFAYDLAASQENTKAKHFFCEEEDSLKQDWTKLRGDLWLNPPFAHIDPWAEKCAEFAAFARAHPTIRRRLFFLTPASIGANWFWKHVHGKALVMPLHPRLSFDGCPVNPKTGKIDPYVKDLMLSVFPGDGFKRFVWKEKKR